MSDGDRPYVKLKPSDSGADVTVISQVVWPTTWPLEETSISVTGVGGSRGAQKNLLPIQIQIKGESQLTVIKPFILKGLPLPLLGRDTMQGLSLRVVSDPQLNTNPHFLYGPLVGTHQP